MLIYDNNLNTFPDDPESDWVTNLMLGAAIRSKWRELAWNLYQSYHVRNKEVNEFYQGAGLALFICGLIVLRESRGAFIRMVVSVLSMSFTGMLC